MRRALIVLAVLVAGLGAPGSGLHPESARFQGPNAISAGYDLESAAALRTGGLLVSPVWLDGTGPTPRPLPRADTDGFSRTTLFPAQGARFAAFRSRVDACRHYTAALALARAGRLALHTTAPPPSRLV